MIFIALLAVAALFGLLALARLGRGGRLGPTWAWVAGAGVLALAVGLRSPWGLALAALAVIAWLWMTSRRTGPSSLDGGALSEARALLGVAADADEAAIRAAYRAAVRAAHPDVGGEAARVRALTAARDLLLKRRT